jgi:hypothetical protein
MNQEEDCRPAQPYVRRIPCRNGVTILGPGKATTGTHGDGYLDMHLNATTRWKGVPESVWAYTLGGYQVLKKWLSYREPALLGRPLTSDEAQDFTHHVRHYRISVG